LDFRPAAELMPRPASLQTGFPMSGASRSSSRTKGGAGGNIAIDTVAHAAPDGYTILLGVPPLVTNRFLYSSLTYDPVADFTPVSLIGVYGNLLVVPNSSPLKTFPEFLAFAKTNPGKGLRYARCARGSLPFAESWAC
jgi:tripartite-type tricarboxylate transporter receptor subunit TctC